MEAKSRLTPYRQLPLVLAATFTVVGLPTLLVLWLRTSGVVQSPWVGTGIGVVASFALSTGGAALWKKRSGSEMLFSELMLWGWLQRRRNDRRLEAAADLLGLSTGRPRAISGGSLSNEERLGLLAQLTSSLENGDPYTHGHSRRVARYAATVAKQMGLPRNEVAKIRAAGAMHDVGKLETPVEVLHKEGRLTDEEFGVVKRHPVDGAEMVATLQDDDLTAMVRHHHERLDGTGYPDRLRGEEIPIGARILAVADTFDAITSTRPYRTARAHKQALDILAAEAGTQLDADAVRAFRSCYTGTRPLAYWTILLNLRPRFAAWLGSGMAPANAAAAGNVMATAATAAAMGGAVLSPAVMAASDAHRTPEARAAAAAPAPVRTAAPAARDSGLSARIIFPGGSEARAGDRRVRDVAVHGARPGDGEATTAPTGGTTGSDHFARRVADDSGDTSVHGGGPQQIPAGVGPQHATPPASHGNANAGHGNSGHGHAYGHGKGNGDAVVSPAHGKGHAYGHYGSPAPVAPITGNPGRGNGPGPATPHGNGGGQGNDKGNGNGNGNGKGNGKGNDKGKGKPSADAEQTGA